MDTPDITVQMAGGMFNYRVGAIIIDSDEILMVKNSGSSFYYTIGGRIQFGESAYDAILREAFEETQIHFEIDRLAYIHENFFTMESDGQAYHELCLFFLLKPISRLRELKSNSFKEEYADITHHWLPLTQLKTHHLYPEFFKTEPLTTPAPPKYFITKNESTTQIT